jgi:diacylglycerol kinase (ATP)
LVEWRLKKRIGPLAYVVAGLKALLLKPAQITVSDAYHTSTGALVLMGNGRRYGGEFKIFPQADPRDGLVDVCVLPQANWWTLFRLAPSLLLRGRLPRSAAQSFQTESLKLTGENPTPLEVDGEAVGHLPATLSVRRSALRVVVP